MHVKEVLHKTILFTLCDVPIDNNWVLKTRVRRLLKKNLYCFLIVRPFPIKVHDHWSHSNSRSKMTTEVRERKTQVNHFVMYIHHGQQWGEHDQREWEREWEREQFVYGGGGGVKGQVYKSGVESWREREREWEGRGEKRRSMSGLKLFLWSSEVRCWSVESFNPWPRQRTLQEDKERDRELPVLLQDIVEGLTFIWSGWSGKEILTINSDLAVTIRVTGLEKHLGLSVGESSGAGREVLQEQSGEDDQGENNQRCCQCAFWIILPLQDCCQFVALISCFFKCFFFILWG